MRAAIPHVDGDIAVIQDADLEYDPADVPGADRADRARRADVVYGSRLSGGRPQRAYLFWHLRRKPLPLAADERPLQHDALRHGDRLQGVPQRGARARSTCARTTSASSPRSPRKVCKRKLRVYELPIAYYGRTYAEGKKITWRDGFKAIRVLLSVRLFG